MMEAWYGPWAWGQLSFVKVDKYEKQEQAGQKASEALLIVESVSSHRRF